MISSLFGSTRHALVLALFAAIGIAATVIADRSSEARANRLHRADAIDESATIYAERVADDPESTRLRYNYGTTLLRIGADGAIEELSAGTSAESEQQRVRAYYNLALAILIQALVAAETDSVLYYAANAVAANKAALRLAPEHENARWNLAIAQRVLETAAPQQGLMDPGNIEGPDNIGDPLVSQTPIQLADREGLDDVPGTGESETPAGDALAPLSPAEANQILGTSHLDPSRIMAKMLVRESRQRRARAIFFQGEPW
ncbi:MAG: hypothetical protein ABL963_02905 [Longimicrobiales bacterium]